LSFKMKARRDNNGSLNADLPPSDRRRTSKDIREVRSLEQIMLG
jgi:hypothetical protein